MCSRLYYLGLCKYTFAQRRNRLTTRFSERIPVYKRRMTVLCPCTEIENKIPDTWSLDFLFYCQ